MALKFDGKLELKDVEIRTSKLEARTLFLNLIWEIKTEIAFDLLKLFNKNSIPKDWRTNPQLLDLVTRISLLHSKNRELHLVDLSEHGINPKALKTPLLEYFNFIAQNQPEFNNLLKDSEADWKKFDPRTKQELITKSAIEALIPDWNSLKNKNGSKQLCSEIILWGKKWNLKDKWCFDFALHCLKNFKVGVIDKMKLDLDCLEKKDSGLYGYLNENRHYGKTWQKSVFDMEQNYRDYFFTDEIPNYPLFNYVWKQRTVNGIEGIFTVEEYYNPLIMSSKVFKQKVEEQFWTKFFKYFSLYPTSFVGNSDLLIDEIRKFQNRVSKYISKCEALVKPYAERSVIKRDDDRHFRWLVEYQVLGIGYNQLAEAKGFDRRAVMNGIQNVSQLIGLTLRPSLTGGRKKGAKDSVMRQERRTKNP